MNLSLLVSGWSPMDLKVSTQDRILILGPSESGKSYLAEKLVADMPRVVVFDPNGDWRGFPGKRLVVHDIRGERLKKLAKTTLKEGDVFMVMEDIDIVMDKWSLNQEDLLRYLFIASRHRRVGWMVIARRPADIPTLVPKQATKVFLFHNDLPHDAEFYEAMFGYGCAETGRTLPLESHEFLYIDVKDPARK